MDEYAAVYTDWSLNTLSLGQVVWVPVVVLMTGQIANTGSGFAWLEFLGLNFLALLLPFVAWILFRTVQRLF